MYKLILSLFIMFNLIVFISIIPNICLSGPVSLVDGNKSDIAQTFTPDPTYSQVPALITGTKVFKKLPSAAEIALSYIDFSSIIAMTVRPSIASTYYYNSDTTKTITLDANKVTLIMLGKGVSSVTLTLGAGTAEVQAMSK
jgi:hypothetical protein